MTCVPALIVITLQSHEESIRDGRGKCVKCLFKEKGTDRARSWRRSTSRDGNMRCGYRHFVKIPLAFDRRKGLPVPAALLLVTERGESSGVWSEDRKNDAPGVSTEELQRS